MPKTKPAPKEYAAASGDVVVSATSKAWGPIIAAKAGAGNPPPDLAAPALRTLPALKSPGETFAQLPLTAIVSSLTNPRKTFHAERLQELAESIRAAGVHQPILVRPLPGDRVLETPREVTHEIVAGERRYRASVLAGVATIPALIRPLTDAQALEIQLVENLQRDDLTVLEEAEGYELLRATTGITAEALAGKINKSKRYVFNRLKLLDLCQAGKEALRAGHIDTSVAGVIATIPSAKQQEKTLTEAVRLSSLTQEKVHTLRTITQWVRTNIMLRIDTAPFATASETLVKAAGSCTRCPKRTGASPDIFAEVLGNSEDLCTDADCYGAKTEAARDALLAKARAAGQTIIEGAEAEDLTNSWNDLIEDYTPLKGTIAIEGQPEQSVRDYIKGSALPIVVVENPHKKTFTECVADDALDALLEERGHTYGGNGPATGHTAKPRSAKDIQADIDRTLATIETRTAAATDNAIATAATTALHQALAGTVAKLWASKPFLRGFVEVLVSMQEASDDVLNLHDVNGDQADAIAQHLARSSLLDLQRMVLAHMLSLQGYDLATRQHIREAAALLGIDAADAEKSAREKVEGDYTASLKSLRAALKTAQAAEKAKNPDLKNAPLAQPEGGAGGRPKNAPGKAARKPKTTKQEAIQGIAQAMQAEDNEAPTSAQQPGAAARVPGPTDAWPFPTAKPGVA